MLNLMRTATPIVAALLAAVILAGCAGQQEYARGRRYFELEQYEEAMKAAEIAVEKDPGSREYRTFLDEVRQTAARDEYNRGLLLYGRNQLSAAIAAFERATRYDPDFAAAEKAYRSVRERRDVVAEIVSAIPGILAADNPDEALNRIVEIQVYSGEFPKITALKVRALEQSTILHAKRGSLALQDGMFDEARIEFQIALNRTPGYSPAVEGLSRATAQIRAGSLLEAARGLMAQGRYSQAHDKLQEALAVVPGHAGTTEALGEVINRWSQALYEEALELEEAGGFDNLAEALRRYERAASLAAVMPDIEDRIEALKTALAPQFKARGEQYEELGHDYHGLALINYQTSLYCDPGQVELSRKVAVLKEAFDNRRAFYIDIRSEGESSVGSSFSKELTQTLKKAVIASGIRDLYVVAPFEGAGSASALAEQRGLAGRHLTIFTSLLSEPVTVRGENKPEVVRSTYRVGTRYIPNPEYHEARRALAEAKARENEVQQDYERLLAEFRRADEEDRDTILGDLEFQRSLLDDAEDETIEEERKLAATDEQVEKEVFQPYDYLVYTVTMEARVEVSLEVADPYRGATKTLEVITGTARAEDAYNEGVQPTDTANAVNNPRDLPTQSELLEAAREDAAEKAVAWLQSALTELSLQYYNRARELEELGNIEGAAEYYYAFYLSAPEKSSPRAREALEFVREQTHLIMPEERR